MSSSERLTSQAAVFETPGKPLRVESVPLPLLGDGETLIRVECCTLCGSDLHSILGHRPTPTPSILGHEIVGRVAETAPNSVDHLGEQLQAGDRVVWSVAASCGNCDRCQSGLVQKCRTLVKYGHESLEGRHLLSGGLAEYCHVLSGTTVVKVPDDCAAEVIAPASCATATVAEAFGQAGEVSGKRVLIFGAGMLGLTAAAMSSELGASEVLVCDIDDVRLERSREFGATSLIRWDEISSTDFEVDIVFELSGAKEAVEASVPLLAIGGTLVLVGSVSPGGNALVDPETIVRRLLRIVGVHNYTPPALVQAVDFLTRTKFPFASLVGESFSLSEINHAISAADESGSCRIAIVP